MQTLAVASRRGRTEVISFYRTDRRRGRQPSPFGPDTSPPPIIKKYEIVFETTIGHCFIPRRTKDKRWLTFRNKK